MITTPSQSPAIEDLSLGERAADTVRQAAHFAHEVRLLKTLAADAAEDGVRAARRTIKQARQAALDARDELTYRVKREPRVEAPHDDPRLKCHLVFAAHRAAGESRQKAEDVDAHD